MQHQSQKNMATAESTSQTTTASAPVLIDTHCHFDADEFAADRDAVAAEAAAVGVSDIVIPGYVQREWATMFDVCRRITSPRLLPAPGLHPCYIQEHSTMHLDELAMLLRQESRIVAVGEIGLDFYLPELKAPDVREKQFSFFEAQLALAEAASKPVILHVRKAHHEVLAVLKQRRFSQGGIVHAFSGGVEEARRYVSLGFCLGIGGSVTYEQSKRLRQVVVEMPLAALVLETDAPDMIPMQHRDVTKKRTRNSPAFLPAVLAGLSALRGGDKQDVAETLRQNSVRVLRL